MTDACVVYITTPSADVADAIAEAAVAERLAACANVLGDLRSVFLWNGETRHDTETPLILKTTPDRLDALTARVKALHPYEEPCVIALPIVGGSQSFINWIAGEVAQS